jgi:hypothetical protein
MAAAWPVATGRDYRSSLGEACDKKADHADVQARA